MASKYKSPGVYITESSVFSVQESPSPICLVFGFSPHGRDSVPMVMSSKNDISITFGAPENGAEKYFVNAGVRILAAGGTPVMARLPYENFQKDNVQYIRYDIGDVCYWDPGDPSLRTEHQTEYNVLKEMNAVDGSMKGTSKISFGALGTASMDFFDEAMFDQSEMKENSLYVFDVRKAALKNSASISVVHDYEGEVVSSRVDFLGVVPVVVSASTALYVQGKIPANSANDKTFSPVEIPFSLDATGAISSVDKDGLRISADWFEDFGPEELQVALKGILESFSTGLEFQRAKAFYAKKSLSDTAALQFPLVKYASTSKLDRENTGKIGIVVFEMVYNYDTEKTDFVLRESHVGTLGSANGGEDPQSIVSVVNSASRFINVQSTVKYVPTRDFFCVSRLPMAVLGMTSAQTMKTVNFASSLLDPLKNILEKYFANIDTNDLDLIVDAGITTVGALAWRNYTDRETGLDSSVAGENPSDLAFVVDPEKDRVPPTQAEIDKCGTAWRQIVSLATQFIENRRGDCLFIADGPRMLNVSLNSPILRHYRTLDNYGIISDGLRAFNGVDTSYAGRYFNWVLAADRFSDSNFWMPPSIAAAEAMCRAQKPYDYPWYAAAGVRRGRISGAYGISLQTRPYTQENDFLYENAWNYLVRDNVVGVYVEGNKTMQSRESALDRINVRRLCNWIKRRARAAANRCKYEGDTEDLRAQFAAEISSFLVTARNNGGLSDFVVICNSSINTPDVIDRNELRCVIGVVPTRTVEFIAIALTVASGEVEFSETFNPEIDMSAARKLAAEEWDAVHG